MCNVKMNHLDEALQSYITEKDEEMSLFRARTASSFPLGNGQSLFVRTSWTRTAVSFDVIIENEALSVDEAFYKISENTEITGRVGLKGLYMAMSCVKELMQGRRTINIIPSDDRRESAYRKLEGIGFARTRIGTYVY